MINKYKLTPDKVRKFWAYMGQHYGSHVHAHDSRARSALAGFLDLMRIADKSAFLNGCTLTIGHGIYPHFEIGDQDGLPLAEQVAICVHEHVHVEQYHDPAFAVGYLLDSSKRAHYEAEAYRASTEMIHWLTGYMVPPDEYAGLLRMYGCTQADVEYVRVYLAKAAPVIERGGIISPVVRVATTWGGWA